MRITSSLVVPFVLALSLGLSACSDSGSPAATSGAKTAAASTVKAAKLPVEPAVKDAKPATGDVKLDTCKTGAGKQTVTGTVRSSAEKQTDYVVTINWLAKDFTVVGRGSAVVKGIEPKKDAKFSITTTVGTGANECRMVAMYGTVAG